MTAQLTNQTFAMVGLVKHVSASTMLRNIFVEATILPAIDLLFKPYVNRGAANFNSLYVT